jgi:prepilin-type N-terminal cleavage/methylation domain-containing protein
MSNNTRRLENGFTLLELIVVIALLGLVSSLATDFMVSETNQQRYETTQQRMEKIRYAIIGDVSRTLNGQPDISGFVNDMGRLPNSLDELVNEPTDCDLIKAGDQSCTAVFSGNLSRMVGWQGPYTDSRTASTDGWGNPWQGDINNGQITSHGLDGIATTTYIDAFEIDQAEQIPQSTYTIQVSEDNTAGTGTSGIRVNFSQDISECSDDSYNTQANCEANTEIWTQIDVCAVLTTVDNGIEKNHIAYTTESSLTYQDHGPVSKDAPFSFRYYEDDPDPTANPGDRKPLTFPMGQAKLSLYRHIATNDCASTSDSYLVASRLITFISGRALLPISF